MSKIRNSIIGTIVAAAGFMPVAASGANPVFEGWYADPEGVVYDDTYWIYPTYSAPYGEQLHFDCFSSKRRI